MNISHETSRSYIMPFIPVSVVHHRETQILIVPHCLCSNTHIDLLLSSLTLPAQTLLLILPLCFILLSRILMTKYTMHKLYDLFVCGLPVKCKLQMVKIFVCSIHVLTFTSGIESSILQVISQHLSIRIN